MYLAGWGLPKLGGCALPESRGKGELGERRAGPFLAELRSYRKRRLETAHRFVDEHLDSVCRLRCSEVDSSGKEEIPQPYSSGSRTAKGARQYQESLGILIWMIMLAGMRLTYGKGSRAPSFASS